MNSLEMFPNDLIEDSTKNTSGVALSDHIDDVYEDIDILIKKLLHIYDPGECPVESLEFLGNFVAAGVSSYDSERTARTKIAYAVSSHKKRGSWQQSVKPKIDSIALGNAVFYHSPSAQWIWLTGFLGEDPTKYWATFGVDGIDDLLGIDIAGSWTEDIIPGVFYIDVDNATLTTAQVQQIVDSISYDDIPAYFRVILGYVSGGVFTVYNTIG